MASIQPEQILMPKKVYIGDAAELRCTFNSSDSVLKELTAAGTTRLSLDTFTQPLDSRDIEVLDLNLAPAGVDYYQLTVSFKAWKTGNINLPSILLGESEIKFQPVTIVSITEQTGTKVLQETTSPLLLPGTSYKLYGTLAALLIVTIAAIRLLIKRKSVAAFIQNRKRIRRCKKNKRMVIKRLTGLKKLQNQSEDIKQSDKDFAEEYQHIMREYLEVRFEFPFSKASTPEFSKGFRNVSNEKKTEAFEKIVSSFEQTDLIRYRENSSINTEEKNQLIDDTLMLVDILEENDVEKGAGND